MDWLQSQTRLFRALLYCYPAEFRHEYGVEMEKLFAHRLRAEPSSRLWLEALADLATSSVAEHWQVLCADLKYGARSLASVPFFTAIAIFVTALGIGSTVSIFSVVNAVLLRSLPYGQPESLVYLWEPNRNFKGVPDEIGPNIPDVYEWQKRNRSFLSIAIVNRKPMNLMASGFTSRIGGAWVSGNFFRTMDVRPMMGRTLDEDDDKPGHKQVAVISHALWTYHFAAARDVIGKQLRINRQTFAIVGVMQQDFGFPLPNDIPYESSEFQQTDIWLPAAYSEAQKTDRANFESADAVARLKPGVSVASAQAELVGIESRLQLLYPPMWQGWTALVSPLVQTIVGPVEKMLWLLLGAVGMVLLIAITNVSNLLLARATARAHELGIRTALGAHRSRIIRQLQTESLMLSIAGGLVGIGFAYAAVHVFKATNPGGIPRFESVGVDLRVLIVSVLLSIAAGVLAGAMPAISASKANVNDLLRQGGNRIANGSSKGRFALLATEVALSVILLVGSGLLIRSYLKLASVDPGISPSTVTFRVTLDDRYNKPELRNAFYRDLLIKLQGMPGVSHAGASSAAPLTNHESVTFAEVRGYGRSSEMIDNYVATADYRKAMGTALLRGRDFTSQDVRLSNTVMINQRFADVYFKDRDPLAGQIRFGIGDLSKAGWLSVVGIMGDVRHMSMEEAGKPQIFQPSDGGENFAIASTLPASQVISQARKELQQLDPALTLEGAHTMRELIHQNNARRSFQTSLMTGFAAVSLLLALTGLYGVMSYWVKQRTSEIGVRLAVGSPRSRIVALILVQGLRVALLGVCIGLACAFGLSRLIGSWLFEVAPADIATFTAVPILLLSVTAWACLIPAWNATRIDPIQALRVE